MSLKKISLFIICILLTMFCRAQNIAFEYELKTVDGQPKNYDNPMLQNELRDKRRKHQRPQSPLSNFLTDILVEIANEYCQKHHKEAVDFSLLNFGGIRSNLKAGNITVGNMFEIAPFENKLVIVELKGSEVRKLFRHFKVKTCEAYSKQVSIAYAGEYFHKALINGQEIDNDKTYRMVTLDFILTGGDNILEGVEILNAHNTGIGIRDAYINHIKKMTAEGQEISSKLDKRMYIIPQPR